MKAYVEIQIRLNLSNGETLHDVLRQFARDTEGWMFPAEESETYQKHIGNEAGYAVCHAVEGLERAIVAIASATSKRPNSFYVPNIVPQDCSQITVEQYNAIGLAFTRDFGSWLRKGLFHGNVRSSNPSKTLADIIPAQKCRMYFERYLNCPSWNPSSIRIHPSDIEKLDVFICALVRYAASVKTHEVERYLVEDLSWKPEDAAWVRCRIDAGLDILAVDRKF